MMHIAHAKKTTQINKRNVGAHVRRYERLHCSWVGGKETTTSMLGAFEWPLSTNLHHEVVESLLARIECFYKQITGDKQLKVHRCTLTSSFDAVFHIAPHALHSLGMHPGVGRAHKVCGVVDHPVGVTHPHRLQTGVASPAVRIDD